MYNMIDCINNIACGKYLDWHWIGEFVIAELCPQATGNKWCINPATIQSCQNIQNQWKDFRWQKQPTSELTSDE
jgi:hypothetical protein